MAQASASKDKKESTSSGQSQTNANFNAPGGQQTLEMLLNSFKNPQNVNSVENRNKLNALQGQGPSTIDTQGRLDAIRKASDSQTQLDLANTRSKMYNRPEGRQDIASADTIARNAAQRDAKLYETEMQGQQFNANAANDWNKNLMAQYNALTPEQQTQLQQNEQFMKALALMRGEDSTSSNKNTSSSLGGSMTANIFGGICWVARSVYGEEDIRWVFFREWLFTMSPKWFFNLYVSKGEKFASWLDSHPLFKLPLKLWMNTRINKLLA